MADEGEDAGFPAGDPRAGTAPPIAPDRLDPAADGAPVPGRRSPGRGGLSDHTRKRIAAQLRTMYDAVAQQPVPDRFADLIARLDADERKNV